MIPYCIAHLLEKEKTAKDAKDAMQVEELKNKLMVRAEPRELL